MVRSAFLRIASLIGGSILLASPLAVAAERSATPSTLLLDAGSGRVLTLPSAAANVFVADSKIAEVRPASPSTLFVFGVAAGRTTVAALDSNGGLVSQFEVTVQTSDYGASQAQAEIARLVPNSNIHVRSLPTTLMLSGSVESPADAARAVAVAKAFAVEKQTVENQMTVRSSLQVTLKVRIVEMSRSLSRKLGINWQALGNFGQIGALPAVIGNINGAANPLGGGLGQVTVDYKNYGVSLGFLPTVYSDGRISVHVAPEVSQLSNANAVTVTTSGSSIVVPSLTVRRAETTVELGSGQTFAIGGLLQDSVTGNRNGLPLLGDLPGIGPAFHDDQFQRGETEVVILVTPYIVRPVSDPSALRVPNAAPVSSDLDRLLYMRASAGTGRPTLAPTPGVAGFIVQ
jgi:pilus assembly protein CpaC